MNTSPVEFQVDFLGFAFCNKRPLSGWKGHGSQTKNKRKRNLQREAAGHPVRTWGGKYLRQCQLFEDFKLLQSQHLRPLVPLS